MPLPSDYQCPRQVGKLALGSEGQESFLCLPPAATPGRAGPAPRLGNTIEPILLAKVWVGQL